MEDKKNQEKELSNKDLEKVTGGFTTNLAELGFIQCKKEGCGRWFQL